jgi:hypothetical protein
VARPLLAGVLLGLLASCAAEPPPVPVEETAPPAPAPYAAPARVEASRAQPDLCPRLASMLAWEADGYAQLRGAPVGRGRWHAASALPGVERCTVEGEAWPRARVSCSSRLIGGGAREAVLDHFEAMAGRIDDCLARGFWFPRDWRRGQLFEFAMDERQLAWVDESSIPPSTVVLKVQQDLASRDYRLRVNLETLR